jgi:hypothetical protein
MSTPTSGNPMKPKLKLIKSSPETDDGIREMTLEEAYELYFPSIENPYEEEKKIKIVPAA